MRTLPKWDDSMSDGCSVPKGFRILMKLETAEQRAACQNHDRVYRLGGSKKDRLIADLFLFLDLVIADMDEWTAFQYYLAVRTGGGPEFKIEGVSWAWGGSYFEYSDEPAVEVT